MSNATDIQRAGQTSHELSITDEQVDLLKRTICKGATNDELQLFLATAQRLGLDPFSKQIHAVKRRENVNGQWQNVMSMQVGIDGFRLQAQRSGRYAGQEGPWWCGPDGHWHEVWPWSDRPAASKVVVLLHGAGGIVRVPAVAHWHEYVGLKSDGGPTKMWDTKGALMLAKCAEALALRKAFPAELSGIYSPDEMQQTENPAGMAPRPVETPSAAQQPQPAPAPAPARDVDERPARLALREVFRGRKLKGEEITRLVNAALDDAGIAPQSDLDKRLRMTDDATLEKVAASLGDAAAEAAGDLVDAEVVSDGLATQEQLDAFGDELDKEVARTAVAIEGGGD